MKSTKMKFEKAELLCKGDNMYQLLAYYKGEDDEKIYHAACSSPLYFSNTPIINYYNDGCTQSTDIDYGFGELSNSEHQMKIEYKAKEMTLEEIEKALGHPVKIVKEK